MPSGATQFATKEKRMSELSGLPSLTDTEQWVDTEKADEGLDVRFYANPVTGDDPH